MGQGVSPLGLLFALLWSWLALRVPRVRAYGLTSLGVPGAVGWALSAGGLEARALGAALLMLVFVAGASLGWGLEEEARAPWWPALVLLIWQPSTLGVLGVSGLALLCSLRWRSGLSWSLGAAQSAQSAAWIAVIALIAALAIGTLWLPAPSALQAPRLPTPRLEIAQTPRAASDSAIFAPTTPVLETPRLKLPPLWIWSLASLALGFYLWRERRAVLMGAPARGGASPRRFKPGQRLMLPLLLLSALLVWATLLAWRGESVPISLRQETLSAAWLVILGLVSSLAALALLWSLWRLFNRWKTSSSQLVPLEPIHSSAPALSELSADRVRAAYATWLRLLETLELRRAQSQTPAEFARLVSVHHPALRGSTNALMIAYERVRYGAIPSETELTRALSALEEWQLEAVRIRREAAFKLEDAQRLEA
jgi:Domain of unknown function (DUF4129)